jgi:hypothetical protein
VSAWRLIAKSTKAAGSGDWRSCLLRVRGIAHDSLAGSANHVRMIRGFGLRFFAIADFSFQDWEVSCRLRGG